MAIVFFVDFAVGKSPKPDGQNALAILVVLDVKKSRAAKLLAMLEASTARPPKCFSVFRRWPDCPVVEGQSFFVKNAILALARMVWGS